MLKMISANGNLERKRKMSKNIKEAIKEANDYADKMIDEAQDEVAGSKYYKWLKSPVNISKGQGVLVLFAFIVFFVSCSADAACTYRKDALGATVYNCTSGISGRITTDVLGTSRDSRTNETWTTDVLGNVRSSTGTVYTTDVLGNIRDNKGTVWRTDVLGNTISNKGTVCSKNALNQIVCR